MRSPVPLLCCRFKHCCIQRFSKEVLLSFHDDEAELVHGVLG